MPASVGQQAKLATYKNLLMKRRNKNKTIGEVLCERHRPTPIALVRAPRPPPAAHALTP